MIYHKMLDLVTNKDWLRVAILTALKQNTQMPSQPIRGVAQSEPRLSGFLSAVE